VLICTVLVVYLNQAMICAAVEVVCLNSLISDADNSHRHHH